MDRVRNEWHTVLAAFLDVVRVHCQEVGSRLDEVLARHPAACSAK